MNLVIPVSSASYRTYYHFDVGNGGASGNNGQTTRFSRARGAWIGEQFVHEPDDVILSAGGGRKGIPDEK